MFDQPELNNVEHDTLQSIFEEFASAAPAAPATPAAPRNTAPARMSSSPAPYRFSPTDVEADAVRLRQSPSAKVGIIGIVKAKMMGDDTYRKVAKTMAARIDMAHVQEETKVAIFLAMAIRIAGFDGVTGALNYMSSRLKEMDPNSPEYEVGIEIMTTFKGESQQLMRRIAERGTDRMLKAGGQ